MCCVHGFYFWVSCLYRSWYCWLYLVIALRVSAGFRSPSQLMFSGLVIIRYSNSRVSSVVQFAKMFWLVIGLCSVEFFDNVGDELVVFQVAPLVLSTGVIF